MKRYIFKLANPGRVFCSRCDGSDFTKAVSRATHRLVVDQNNRRSVTKRYYCEKHARQVAARHGLECPS